MQTIIERMCIISEKMRSATDRDVIALENSDKAMSDIQKLSRILMLTQTQTVILTAIVRKAYRSHIDGKDLASMLGLEYLQFLAYSDDVDELRRRGYIRVDSDGDVSMPREVLANLRKNEPILPEPTEGLDALELLSRMRKIIGMRYDEHIDTNEAVCEMEALMELNPDNSISRVCSRYRDVHCLERMLLYLLIYLYHYRNDDMVGYSDIDDYYTECELDHLRSWLNMGTSSLLEMEAIEFTSDDGFITKDHFHILDEVKECLFEDTGGITPAKRQVRASRLIEASSIVPKELFYNETEERQVARLRSLLSPGRFKSIRNMMSAKGLRTGFTCLFYGGPGTGKTETVYQLARESGRDIFVVDVSQVKSKWVGDSEKNISAVFSRYRACVEAGGDIPILLFNEADAIFGIRSEGAGSAVDKMENSIQDIILQEMEDLDGILIATTNLTASLDKAFERRFLYKIRFDNPSAEARSRIWRKMIPELSEAEAASLASDFPFSGGQIENVSRKRTIGEILSGEQPSFSDIMEFCREETIDDGSSRQKIGF